MFGQGRATIGRILAAGATTVALAATVLAGAAPASAAVSWAQLALRWAPVHYQDVDVTGDHALSGRSDYLTKVDFDGDLAGRDNWDGATKAGVSFAAYA